MWGVGRGGDSLALIKFHARPHGKGCVCVCVRAWEGNWNWNWIRVWESRFEYALQFDLHLSSSRKVFTIQLKRDYPPLHYSPPTPYPTYLCLPLPLAGINASRSR